MNIKKYNNEFVNHVVELLEPFGAITVRKMFSGFGIYNNGVIFALIIEQELCFKADAEAAKFFELHGSEPFTYERRNKTVRMSYWKAMPEILEDRELLEEWINVSYNVHKSSF